MYSYFHRSYWQSTVVSMSLHDEHLAHARAHEFAALRWHWDEAYLIGWHREPEESEGEFVATRKDGQGTIFAPTAHDLRQAMRLDYSARPVARPAGS